MAPVGNENFAVADSGAPSSRCQSSDIMNGTFSKKPHFVLRTPVTMPPTPAGTKTAAKIAPVATTLHLTHEDRARPRIDRSEIQMSDPAKRPLAI